MEHTCNKEMEIATMAVKIDNIEKSVEEVKSAQKEMAKKLDTFYQMANETYVTKPELQAEITRLEASKSFLLDNWDKIIYMAFLAFVGLLYLKDKI